MSKKFNLFSKSDMRKLTNNIQREANRSIANQVNTMKFNVTCEKCGHTFKTSQGMATCPECGNQFQVKVSFQ